MPNKGNASRGKKSHKGQRRHFSNEEELRSQLEEDGKKNWRKKKEINDSSDEGEGENAERIKENSEDSESDDESQHKAKGVSGLIEIENPNRISNKTKKANEIDPNSTAPPQLSRREREEIQKQQARLHYQKLHAEGKTDEARADLARLAIIRKQREEAAKKREEEKKVKETMKQSSKTGLKTVNKPS